MTVLIEPISVIVRRDSIDRSFRGDAHGDLAGMRARTKPVMMR
jgi:hypothetical protein